MQVLVTGGAGYIGSHTAKALSLAGHTPVVLDSLELGHEWAVRWGSLEKADLGYREAVSTVFGRYRFDAVVHFAGYIAVGESMTNPGKYFASNVSNTLNLLESMREAGVSRIVFSSTAATYGNPESVPMPETHPQRPVNPYGESKLMVEKILDWYSAAHGFGVVKLRYFNAAGADPDGEIGEDHCPETHLIPLVLDAAYGRRASIQVFGTDYDTPDGTAIRDYIHVNDLAAAHLRALDLLQARGGNHAYNLGTGKGISVREVISAVERVSGRPVPVKESGRRAGDAPALVADSSRARAELSWSPAMSSIDDIVRTADLWHRKHFGVGG